MFDKTNIRPDQLLRDFYDFPGCSGKKLHTNVLNPART